MTQLPSVAATPSPDQPFGQQNALNELNLDTFLQLMITELQNQDPLNPMENDELLAQISQIREVGATDKLTETLDSVLLGQNIASATNLIGNQVEALSDDNERVSGVVDRVAVEDGEPKLFLQLGSEAQASREAGSVEEGTYKYRVVWQDESGNMFGVDLPPGKDDFVVTHGQEGVDQAIRLNNLPFSSAQKQIYRTDASGEGDYKLVATLPNGSTSSFVDTYADDERSSVILNANAPIQVMPALRSFTARLKNVSEIRAPDGE